MPVGGLAVAVLAEVAPLAGHAREVVLEEDQVAFLDAFALDELLPGLRNHADVLVTHDDRVRNVLLIVLDVAPADPGDLDLHQAASSGMSGKGNSRTSVLLGPTFTAASVVSATFVYSPIAVVKTSLFTSWVATFIYCVPHRSTSAPPL